MAGIFRKHGHLLGICPTFHIHLRMFYI
jgi:hypothetical protein